MFAIGDKVVYPMHGAGIIEAIEEREILGETQRYYVMTMSYGGMRVMIPVKSVNNVGLRQVVSKVEVEKVIAILGQDKDAMCLNWNKRFKANMDKIKSGDICEVAEVIRNLALQNKGKKLSTVEKRLFDSAKQILVSELVLANIITIDQTDSWLEQFF